MNQILITEKLYVTPELKRKKRLFKIEFFLSVFLVCILSSYYIYAEYNRSESEQVSQKILAEVKSDTTTKKIDESEVMIIVLDEEKSNKAIEPEKTNITSNTYTAPNGEQYFLESIVTIPSIGISYPVLTKPETDDLMDEQLEISVNKFWGPDPNEIGNYCIVGHNYRNGKMFGRLSELVNGDIVELEDLTGRKLKYKVYYKDVISPNDTSCTSQQATTANGKRELTLITCTNYGKDRLYVKCRQV